MAVAKKRTRKVTTSARETKQRRRTVKSGGVRSRIKDLRARRPHHSFRLTKRRDYRRDLDLPKYWSFAREVVHTILAHRKTFMLLALIYVVAGLSFGMMVSQDTYNTMVSSVRELGKDILSGGVGDALQAGAVSVTTFMGNGAQLNDIQKFCVALVFLLVWLTTVWLLREYMSDRQPRLRDGLYNSAAPLISTIIVMLWFLVQLLPIALLAIAYSALIGAGLLTNGFGTFIFSMIAILIVSLVLYWVTSTFLAAVIVTLPGMYPMKALRAAGDIVIGRRLRVLYRILWLTIVTVVAWLVVMTPLVMLDIWLTDHFSWLAAIPYVPLIALLLGAATTIWCCSYIYLLYRRIVTANVQ